MAHSHLYSVFPVQVFGKVLSAINAAMLATGAAERKHQIGETAFDVALAMRIGKTVYGIEESEDFTIVFKESDYRLVHSRQLFVRLIASGIVG